jgi:DNA-3-methyladenine glycosylase
MIPPPLHSAPIPISRDFYLQPSVVVARRLLGKTLVRRFDDGVVAKARIVETEAYTQDEPASHAFRGETARNRTMFGPPGHAYVYFTYGIHHCLNAVCAPPGRGDAVLIRAIEPIENAWRLLQAYDGITESTMEATEEAARRDRRLGAGPGRLAKALGLDLHDNGADLTSAASYLYVATADDVADDDVAITTRIGITRAVDLPWRFYVRSSKFVSKR